MKRLNVKKLAAVGAGAALIGMALAPMAAALMKEDVLKGDGTPFDVVVGNGAAHTDYLWGGNIAAKLAQLATEDTAVSCTASGWLEGKGPTGEGTSEECEMTTGLSVDVAVGGTTVYKPGTAYTYDDTYMNSGTTVEWANGMLGNQKLNNLYDETWTYTYNGSSYTQTVKEYIGIQGDVKMDTTTGVRDLVSYLDSEGDINYMLRLGAGIPYNPAFTKNDNNVIYVGWFGKKLVVLSASSTEVKLIDESEKSTYYEGQRITGLKGKGDYAGQELEVEFVSLTYSSAQGAYSAKFNLYDAEGNLIDDYTAGAAGVFLESQFTQSGGGYPLQTSVYVEEFAKEDVSDQGYIVVTIGTNTVQLVHGGMYPYDSTVTSSSRKYWKVAFGTTTATVGASANTPVINEITVYNTAIEGCSAWNDKAPLWAKNDALLEHDDAIATFLNCESEDALGYGYATFEFKGWKNAEEKTCAEVGADISANGGTGIISDRGIIYTDTGEQKHYVPFYINSLDSSTEEDFYFDGGQSKRYYFRMGSAVSDINVCHGELLNGIAVDINSDGMRTDGAGRAGTAGTSYDVNGVKYVVVTAPTAAPLDDNCIILDTNFWFQISTTAFDSSHTTVNGLSGAPFDGNFYVDNANSFSNFTTGTTSSVFDYAVVRLLGDDDEQFFYAFFYDESGDIWLMLDNSTNFTPRFLWDLALVGTEIDTATETGTVNTSFYVPDNVKLGAGATTGTYRVAQFTYTEPSAQTGTININTNGGVLPPIGNTNLSGYTYEANFTDAQQTLTFTYDNESSNIQAGWSDYSSKFWIENQGSWNMCTPQNQEYPQMSILGPAAEVEVTGDTLEGLEEGDTGTTTDNISVTVSKIYGECDLCECAPGGGVEPTDVDLDVSPSVVKKINKIGSQILYTDSEYFGATGFVSVGGHKINDKSMGAGLENELLSAGDTFVDQTANGDWIVAGFLASDTITAAKEFIELLDAAFVE